MKITNNNVIINNIQNKELIDKKETIPEFCAQKTASQLPSYYTNGVSQLNTEIPVSYSKVCEIPVPGVDKNACLYKLSNGQKVVILPKKGPTFIRTSFNVGSMNEPDELRGISHFIEHSLFNGSKNLAPGEYDKEVTKLGGYTNAYTGYNETQYYLNLQLLNENSLEEAIKLNAMQTQFPTFDKYQLEREKEPVKSEIDMCNDNYMNFAENTLVKNLYNLKSTSTDLVAGRKENINSFTREKVLDYYNTWYTPDNTTTVICGDVDVDETIKLVSKYFTKKPDTSKFNQRKYEKFIPTNKASRVDYKQNKDPGAYIQIGFPIEADTSVSDYRKLEVLTSYLASQNSNVSKVLDKYSLNLSFDRVKLSSEKNSPSILAAGIYLPEEQVEEVLKVIYEGITDLKNNPPKEEDIKDIINTEIHSLKNESEYSEGISQRLVKMANENDLNYFYDFQKDIASITSRDISETAKKFLDLNKTAICVMHPSSTPDAQIKSNYENAKNSPAVSFGNSKTADKETTGIKNNVVSFGKSKSVIDSVSEDVSKISCHTLQNNIKLLTRTSDNSANASFLLNINCKQPNHENYASEMLVLNELLNRGSAFKDNLTFSKLLQKSNSSIGISVGQNGLMVCADFPSEKSNEVLPLLKEALLSPNFSQTEFERAKKVVGDMLKSNGKSASDKLIRELFPDINYYADNKKQLEALEKMTLSDCINLYNKFLYNSQAQASVTGSKEAQDSVLNQISYGFPTFKQFEIGKEYKNNRYRENQKEILLTDTEENAQAKIIQSYQYKTNGNIEDYAKIELLNLILGSGGMSSRLFRDLRVESNLAYSVRSYTSEKEDVGMMNLKIDTSTDTSLTNEADPQNINKSLDGFNRNIQKLKTEYVSEEELENAKTMMKTDILNSLEGNNSLNISMAANNSSFYGQNYDIELLKAVDKITVQDIMAAANYVFKNPPVTSILASKKTFTDLNIPV